MWDTTYQPCPWRPKSATSDILGPPMQIWPKPVQHRATQTIKHLQTSTQYRMVDSKYSHFYYSDNYYRSLVIWPTRELKIMETTGTVMTEKSTKHVSITSVDVQTRNISCDIRGDKRREKTSNSEDNDVTYHDWVGRKPHVRLISVYEIRSQTQHCSSQTCRLTSIHAVPEWTHNTQAITSISLYLHSTFSKLLDKAHLVRIPSTVSTLLTESSAML